MYLFVLMKSNIKEENIISNCIDQIMNNACGGTENKTVVVETNHAKMSVPKMILNAYILFLFTN